MKIRITFQTGSKIITAVIYSDNAFTMRLIAAKLITTEKLKAGDTDEAWITIS